MEIDKAKCMLVALSIFTLTSILMVGGIIAVSIIYGDYGFNNQFPTPVYCNSYLTGKYITAGRITYSIMFLAAIVSFAFGVGLFVWLCCMLVHLKIEKQEYFDENTEHYRELLYGKREIENKEENDTKIEPFKEKNKELNKSIIEKEYNPICPITKIKATILYILIAANILSIVINLGYNLGLAFEGYISCSLSLPISLIIKGGLSVGTLIILIIIFCWLVRLIFLFTEQKEELIVLKVEKENEIKNNEETNKELNDFNENNLPIEEVVELNEPNDEHLTEKEIPLMLYKTIPIIEKLQPISFEEHLKEQKLKEEEIKSSFNKTNGLISNQYNTIIKPEYHEFAYEPLRKPSFNEPSSTNNKQVNLEKSNVIPAATNIHIYTHSMSPSMPIEEITIKNNEQKSIRNDLEESMRKSNSSASKKKAKNKKKKNEQKQNKSIEKRLELVRNVNNIMHFNEKGEQSNLKREANFDHKMKEENKRFIIQEESKEESETVMKNPKIKLQNSLSKKETSDKIYQRDNTISDIEFNSPTQKSILINFEKNNQSLSNENETYIEDPTNHSEHLKKLKRNQQYLTVKEKKNTNDMNDIESLKQSLIEKEELSSFRRPERLFEPEKFNSQEKQNKSLFLSQTSLSKENMAAYIKSINNRSLLDAAEKSANVLEYTSILGNIKDGKGPIERDSHIQVRKLINKVNKTPENKTHLFESSISKSQLIDKIRSKYLQ